MGDSENGDIFQRAITKSLPNQGISSKLSMNNAYEEVADNRTFGYRYPSKYMDESANQEAPSSHTIFELLASTSKFVHSSDDSTKDLFDAASTLSSGYFSNNSQSSQPISDVVDSCSQQNLYSHEGGACKFAHRPQSIVTEGSLMRCTGKQTWREPSGTFRRVRSSIGPSCRALFSDLPTIREGRNSIPRSVRFAENSLTHSPLRKRPRFSPSPSFLSNPSSEHADANLDDTIPIDGGSDEVALLASSPLKFASSRSLELNRKLSSPKRSPPPKTPLTSKHCFSRCASVPANIAQDQLTTSTDDFCSSHQRASVLPIIERTGAGVNFVSVNTVAHLLTNNGTKGINFVIVDCRFPYEYNAGHVRGAVNLYTPSDLVREVFHRIPAQSALANDSFLYLGDQLDQMLMKENSIIRLPVVNSYVQSGYSSSEDGNASDDSVIVEDPLGEANVRSSSSEVNTDYSNSPQGESGFISTDVSIDANPKPSHVIIFHCEFSSQRAPSMAKFLRRIDRTSNCSRYPFLFFPDLYVMKGGYAEFYNRFPNLCEPREYMKMFHRSHRSDLRYYRRLTKHVSVSCDACFRNSSLCNFATLSGSESKENVAQRLRKVHTMYSHKYAYPLTPSTDQQKLTFGDESPTAMKSDDGEYSKCVANDSETSSLLPGQSLDSLDDDYLRLAEVVVRIGEHVTAAFEHGRKQGPRSNMSSMIAPPSGVSKIIAPYRQGPFPLTDSPPTPIRSLNSRLRPQLLPLSFSSSESSGPNSPEPSKSSWLL